MSFARTFLLGSIALFGLIGVAGVLKKVGGNPEREELKKAPGKAHSFPADQKLSSPLLDNGEFFRLDRVKNLFNPKKKRLPFIETVSYVSNVPWLRGRPAWISDYASYYSTSRSFIARSLTGKGTYQVPKVKEGDKFNVFSLNCPLQFYLVVDLTRCQMGLYSYLVEKNERIFLKAYPIGLGKKLGEFISMTPRGLFILGNQVGVYNKGDFGYHLGKKIEMVQVFGTRWLPFEGKGGKGIGIQGAPWTEDPKTKELKEDVSSIGKYESDGCIRMKKEDIEELYALVVTKPTFIEVVNEAFEAELPGKEILEYN